MNQIPETNRRLVRWLPCAGLSAAALLLAATAGRAADDEVVSLQSFVVTGSNILRLDMEKIVPVTVLNMDAINTRMAFTPVDLLRSV